MDDVELGPVEVTWSVEEFYSVFGDDDKEFVGTLNGSGLFTPESRPTRIHKGKFGRNNYPAMCGWLQQLRTRKTKMASRLSASRIWW